MKKTALALFLFLTAFPSHADDIKIGVALPLTGLYAPLSQQIVQGVELALEKINASGGVLGKKLVLEKLDDKCTPETAKEIANQLVGKEVIAVIGHLCDRASIETSEIYAKNKIIQMSPASQNPAFTENRPNPKGGTYRLAPRGEQQAEAIVNFLINEQETPTIALVDDGSTYGNALKENLTNLFEDNNIKSVFSARFKAGAQSYPVLTSRLIDSGASHIIIAALHLDAATLIRGLDRLSSKATIVGGEALVQNNFPRLVLEGNSNRQTLDKIYISFPPDDRRWPEAENIIKEFQKKNIRPIGLTLRGYAALVIISDALKKAGTKDYETLMNTLNNESFKTPIGEISFNNKGDASLKGYTMHEWDGKILKALK